MLDTIWNNANSTYLFISKNRINDKKLTFDGKELQTLGGYPFEIFVRKDGQRQTDGIAIAI